MAHVVPQHTDRSIHELPTLSFRARNDHGWTIEKVDKHAKELLGDDFDLKRHTQFGEFVHPEDLPRIEREIAAALDAGDEYFVVYRIVRTDDTSRRVLERGRRVHGNGVEYLEGCVLDITAADHSIGNVDDRWRMVINSLPTAVSVHIDGTMVFANEAAARLVGASSPEEIIGTDSFAYIREDHREQYREWVEAMGNIPSTPYEELPIYRVDGSCLWVRVQPSYVVFEGRQAIQTVLVDISDERRRRLESERRNRVIHATAQIGLRFLKSNDPDKSIEYALEEVRAASKASQVALLRAGEPALSVGASVVTPDGSSKACIALVADGRPRFGLPSDVLTAQCNVHETVSMVALVPVPIGRTISASLLLAFEGDVLPWTSAGQNALVVVGATMGHALEQAVVDEKIRASERRYRLLVEQASDGILLADENLVFVEANDAACAITGYSRQELIELTPRSLLTQAAISELPLSWSHLAPGEVVRHEREMVRKDGTIFVAEVSLVKNHDGFIQAIVRDVSDRIQAEQALRAHRDQLELALDSAHMGIWDMNLDTGEVIWNEHTARIFGIPLHEFRGTIEHVMQFIHPDDHAPIMQALEHAKQTGANFEVMQRIRRPDGQIIWSWGIGRVNRTESGHNRLLGTLQDISETVNAANSVRRKSARIRGMLSALPDLLLRVRAGETGDLVIAVPSRQRTEGTAETRRMHEGLPVHARRLFERAFRRIKRNGEVVTFSYELSSGDDGRIFEVRMAPSGKSEAVAIVRDITSERRREMELVQARDEAQQMVRLKSAFLSNMSHEIRTPLTSIIGFSDMLAEMIDGDSREFVGIIRSSGERLMQTLNALLDLAQIESGAIELVLRPSDVFDRLRTAVEFYAPQARLKGIELDLAGDHEKPLLALIDAAATDRILAHLLSNAIKFTSEGKITASARRDGDDVLLEITDSGIGISDEFQRRMFDPFHQESDGLARDFEGTGLGLTIIRHLVAMMDASISVVSTRGEGSIFTVRLKGVKYGEHVATKVRRPEHAMPAPAESRRRVLIVEDNATTRILMEQVLADEFDVASVATGEEAMKMITESPPDAVLLDVTLAGGVSGEEIVCKLRRRGFSGLPIIAVTARTLSGDRERLLELGFDGYVSKPFKKEHLVAALRIADHAAAVDVTPTSDLDSLLELCLEEGLIDHYEHGDGSVIVTQDIAHLKLPRERAHAALQAMLESC